MAYLVSEGDNVPFFIQYPLKMIAEQIHELIKVYIADKDLFLVDLKVTPGKITVLVDKPAGITIDECVLLNRYLYKEMESSGVFENKEFEVGSPGMDQPLKVIGQYKRRIGRPVKIILNDGKQHNGILVDANEQELQLLETIKEKIGGKKVEKQLTTTLPMQNIKETKLEFK